MDYYIAVEKGRGNHALDQIKWNSKNARNLTNCKYFDALSFINYDHFSTPNSKKKNLSQHF